MSAASVIQKALGHKTPDRAQEVEEALDAAGYLIEPGEPLHVMLANLAVQRVTELCDGVELEWNGNTVVGIVLRDGVR